MSQCQQTNEISRFLNSLVSIKIFLIVNNMLSVVAGWLQRTAGLNPPSAQVHTPRTWLVSSITMVPVITSSPAISRRTLTLLSVSTMCVVACTTALPISSSGAPPDACKWTKRSPNLRGSDGSARHRVPPVWTDQWPLALAVWSGSFWMPSWQWNHTSQGWRPPASTSYAD